MPATCGKLSCLGDGKVIDACVGEVVVFTYLFAESGAR